MKYKNAVINVAFFIHNLQSQVFAMIEGLADGGVKQGLPRDLAIKLSAMTFYGAAKMLLETNEHPAVLKEAVQSPGGSTVYGIHEMGKHSKTNLPLLQSVYFRERRFPWNVDQCSGRGHPTFKNHWRRFAP